MMSTHDFLSVYDAKILEYLLAVSYLALFVPMWRFVHGGNAAAVAVHAPARAASVQHAAALGWFSVPADVALHAGHAWARTAADGVVTIGIDEFAQKLIDPERAILPSAGDRVIQGQPAFAIGDTVVTVPVLSPVDGEVVEVNPKASLRDPYGAGWLFKVKVPAGLKQAQLMAGDKARDYLERAAQALSLRMNPELGYVMQDGGTPIHGIAKALAGDSWTSLARHFLQTEAKGEKK
jgi:glycine cleavage system H lipoate-binding protein